MALLFEDDNGKGAFINYIVHLRGQSNVKAHVQDGNSGTLFEFLNCLPCTCIIFASYDRRSSCLRNDV